MDRAPNTARTLLLLSLALLAAASIAFTAAVQYEQQALTYIERDLAHPGAGGFYGLAFALGTLAGLAGGGWLGLRAADAKHPAAAAAPTSS